MDFWEQSLTSGSCPLLCPWCVPFDTFITKDIVFICSKKICRSVESHKSSTQASLQTVLSQIQSRSLQITITYSESWNPYIHWKLSISFWHILQPCETWGKLIIFQIQDLDHQPHNFSSKPHKLQTQKNSIKICLQLFITHRQTHRPEIIIYMVL